VNECARYFWDRVRVRPVGERRGDTRAFSALRPGVGGAVVGEVRRGGLTLVEMLMALTITALIGAAIASMLSAVAYGTSSSQDIRSLVVKNKTLSSRITAAVRGSAQLLSAADGYVVLWTKDLNGSGVPDLLELRRIELDGSTDELTSYTPNPSAVDVVYAITDDFDAITTGLIGSGDLDGALWATGVSRWAITLDDVDPLAAGLMSFKLTLDVGGMSDVSVNAVSLRD
jgi:type II secretory pathway pseudopilin PulG